jgi:hydrogenase expression/formation protein HypC
MCLAIPAQITELIDETTAMVQMGGVTRQVQVNLIEAPKVGEYLIIHAGFALSRLDEDEAHKTLQLLREVGILAQ